MRALDVVSSIKLYLLTTRQASTEVRFRNNMSPTWLAIENHTLTYAITYNTVTWESLRTSAHFHMTEFYGFIT